MNLRLCLLCVPFFVIATTDIFADDAGADPDSVIRELCQNGRAEGVYMQSFGNDTGYALLICTIHQAWLRRYEARMLIST